MALLRIRTEIEDRPGRLAILSPPPAPAPAPAPEPEPADCLTVPVGHLRAVRLRTSSGGRVRRTEDPGILEIKLRLAGRSATAAGPVDSVAR